MGKRWENQDNQENQQGHMRKQWRLMLWGLAQETKAMVYQPVEILSNFPVDHIPLEIALPSSAASAQCFRITVYRWIFQFMQK